MSLLQSREAWRWKNPLSHCKPSTETHLWFNFFSDESQQSCVFKKSVVSVAHTVRITRWQLLIFLLNSRTSCRCTRLLNYWTTRPNLSYRAHISAEQTTSTDTGCDMSECSGKNKQSFSSFVYQIGVDALFIMRGDPMIDVSDSARREKTTSLTADLVLIKHVFNLFFLI